jgi:AcrR family transcriptional regulator
VRHEVKQAALRQLAESGPAAVSISAIGKQLGGSGPALYRYSTSRDELLTERALLAWSRLHGFVSLEIAGNYASMNIDPDQVFEIQLATLTA